MGDAVDFIIYFNTVLTAAVFFVLYYYKIHIISNYVGVVLRGRVGLKRGGVWVLADITAVAGVYSRRMYVMGYIPWNVCRGRERGARMSGAVFSDSH